VERAAAEARAGAAPAALSRVPAPDL